MVHTGKLKLPAVQSLVKPTRKGILGLFLPLLRPMPDFHPGLPADGTNGVTADCKPPLGQVSVVLAAVAFL